MLSLEPLSRDAIAAAFHVERGICRRIVRSPPLLARHDVCSIRSDQWWFGAVGSYLAVALFCFLQQLGQSHHVGAEPSSGKPRFDLLEQPAVTVGITE